MRVVLFRSAIGLRLTRVPAAAESGSRLRFIALLAVLLACTLLPGDCFAPRACLSLLLAMTLRWMKWLYLVDSPLTTHDSRFTIHERARDGKTSGKLQGWCARA